MKTNKWEKWEKTRAKGTLRFIILGGLYWGIAFTTIFCLFKLLAPKFSILKADENFFEYESILVLLTVSLIIGVIWSTTMWIFSEFSYQASLGKKVDHLWIPKQKDNLK